MVDNELILLKECDRVCFAQAIDVDRYGIFAIGAAVKSIRVLSAKAGDPATLDKMIERCDSLIKQAKVVEERILDAQRDLVRIEAEIEALRAGE